MNICVLSVGPIFSDHVHGGSQKILREILISLADEADVTVLCVSRPDLLPHCIAPRVNILPVLTYRETYPNPYDTSPLKIVNIAATVHKHSRKADVIYIHDSQMIFRTSLDSKPMIFSCRDLYYPETIVGLLVHQQNALIVNSDYSETCALSLLRRQRLQGNISIKRIYNGIDINHFSPYSNVKVSEFFGSLIPDNAYLILSPGRAELSKGHHEALELVKLLTETNLSQKVYLGVPRYIDNRVDNSLNNYYEELSAYAEQLGIRDQLVFHNWVPYHMMPRLYSVANLVVGLGNFPECFGNTYVEAISCGTPCIVSKVGANRSIPPNDFVTRVPYGDITAAANAAVQYLLGKCSLPLQEARSYVYKNYNFSSMVNQYAVAIKNTACGRKIGTEYSLGETKNDIIQLAPWVSLEADRLFHDYEGTYIENEEIVTLARFIEENPCTKERCQNQGFSKTLLEQAYDMAVIGPST